MTATKQTKQTVPSHLETKETKLAHRARLASEIIADKVAESRIRCLIGEKLVEVRETFYPTDPAKRPTSKQVETFKRWCALQVDIGSSTVDQYIAAYAVIQRAPSVVEKVTTTRSLQALGRLNDAELTAAVSKLPAGATTKQVEKVMAQVSKKESAKQTNGAAAAETKKKDAARRDQDAARTRLEKVLPGLIVECTAAIDEDPATGLLATIQAVAEMVSQCGILSFQVLPDMLRGYGPDAETEETDSTETDS